MVNCEACKDSIQDNAEKLKCKGSCQQNFHFTCVGFIEETFKKLSRDQKNKWKCWKCKDPISNVESVVDQETGKQTADILSAINEIKEDNVSFKKEIMQKFLEFEKSLEYATNLVTETMNSNKKLAEEINCIKQQNTALLQENKALKSQISEMKSDIVDLKQYSRRLNIEVSNLPEIPNENMTTTVENILKELDVDLKDKIVTAHRVPTVKKNKIKPIIIQFNSMEAKSNFMKKAKSKHINANAVYSNLDSTVPVYFNDHLCAELKQLLYQCKCFKRDNNFKFCWNRNGKIFLRKDEGSRVFCVKSISDLTNVIV